MIFYYDPHTFISPTIERLSPIAYLGFPEKMEVHRLFIYSYVPQFIYEHFSE